MSAAQTETINCTVAADGTFTGSFGPQAAGNWSVIASSQETQKVWPAVSSQFMVTVTEQSIYMKYSLYIAVGLVAALAAGGAVYYFKFNKT